MSTGLQFATLEGGELEQNKMQTIVGMPNAPVVFGKVNMLTMGF